MVTTMRTEDLSSWKWRDMSSKSAMFLETLFCLRNDRSTLSSNIIIAQWVNVVHYNGVYEILHHSLSCSDQSLIEA